MRDASGASLSELRLIGSVFEHPSRDLVLVPLDSLGISAAWQNHLASATVPLNALDDFQDHFIPQRALIFLGHNVEGEAARPRLIPGRWLVRSDRQAFAQTAEVLEIGMCGGPVMLCSAPEAALQQQQQLCVGMIEGIVPSRRADSSSGLANTPQERASEVLGGAAALIEGRTIASFVRAVEQSRRLQ